MVKVLNKRKDVPTKNTVYIGRPSKWGNPFSHLSGTKAQIKVASREEAIEQYKKFIYQHPELIDQIKKELKGKDLMCWCSPLPCHGDVLAKIANED